MKEGLRFVDSDMHVMEPPDLFDRYLDPTFKHRVSAPVGPTGARAAARPVRPFAGAGAGCGEAATTGDARADLRGRSSAHHVDSWRRQRPLTPLICLSS